MIIMKNLNKIYDTGKVKVQALDDIQLSIAQGEMVAIVGPSGSGKSTLMNIIGCLDIPSSGEYFLEGKTVQNLKPNALAEVRNKKIGFVFQNFNLLPHSTAFENVELPMIYKGTNKKERVKRVEWLFEKVSLKDRMYHKPTELSGGQMQRVAIARSLANEPKILLADEPTGNLDSQSGVEIMELFFQLHKAGTTIIIITHDKRISESISRVITIKDGKVFE